MRQTLRTFAAASAIALLAAACGDAPDEGSSDGGDSETTSTESVDDEATDSGEASSDLSGCMVTDTGLVDDRSFNQTAYAGLERAEDELGATIDFLESTSEADFQPNISEFVESGDCSLIVTVGFLLDQATQDAATANPDQDFAIVDFDFVDVDADNNVVGDITFDNVRELVFETDQAAFLAGYLAASETETGIVATYGGLNIPTVTIFMDGFLAGVNHYNEQNASEVEVLGWDGDEGLFINSFESQQDGRNVADQLLQQGADIIMPVAGKAGIGTVTAVEDSTAGGQGAQVIWVDTDGAQSVPESADVFLTSVLKRMDNAVFDTMQAKANNEFEGGLYTGTLENEGVGIVTDNVEGEMAATLDELRQQIIDGELETVPSD